MNEKTKDEISLAIKTARAYEKMAIAEAKKRANERIKEEVAEAHEAVVDTFRVALLSGMTARQAGLSYGSSDARTIKALVAEAMSNDGGKTKNPHPTWKLSNNGDGTFNITVYGLGDGKLSGHARCKMDEDRQNFSVVDGDMWIQIQLYKLGYKDDVIKEATNGMER
jgi:hypothetical protein